MFPQVSSGSVVYAGAVERVRLVDSSDAIRRLAIDIIKMIGQASIVAAQAISPEHGPARAVRECFTHGVGRQDLLEELDRQEQDPVPNAAEPTTT